MNAKVVGLGGIPVDVQEKHEVRYVEIFITLLTFYDILMHQTSKLVMTSIYEISCYPGEVFFCLYDVE